MNAVTDSRNHWTTELYCLVAELQSHRWPAHQIAHHLGVTPRRIQQVIADMAQAPTPENQLNPLLIERIIFFAKRKDCCT